MLQTWSSVFQESLRDIWIGTASFAPKLIIAIIVLVIGWVFGNIVDKLISQIARTLKIDNVLKSAQVDSVVSKAGFNLNSGAFIGGIVKWFIIAVFLVASFDILGLSEVNAFLQQVVLIYLPKVLVASLIILAAAIVAEVAERLVIGAAKAAELKSANLSGRIARWSIWIFAVLAVLFELGVAATFIQTLFTGVVVALSLAFGLSFGLGGQEAAARAIEKVRSELTHHHE
jgi:small-conductance mechanosensitive channel